MAMPLGHTGRGEPLVLVCIVLTNGSFNLQSYLSSSEDFPAFTFSGILPLHIVPFTIMPTPAGASAAPLSAGPAGPASTAVTSFVGALLSRYMETALDGIHQLIRELKQPTTALPAAKGTAVVNPADVVDAFTKDPRALKALLETTQRRGAHEAGAVVAVLDCLAAMCGALPLYRRPALVRRLLNEPACRQLLLRSLDTASTSESRVAVARAALMLCDELVSAAAATVFSKLYGGVPLHVAALHHTGHAATPLFAPRTLWLQAYVNHSSPASVAQSCIRTHGFLTLLTRDLEALCQAGLFSIVRAVLLTLDRVFLSTTTFPVDEKRRLLRGQTSILRSVVSVLGFPDIASQADSFLRRLVVGVAVAAWDVSGSAASSAAPPPPVGSIADESMPASDAGLPNATLFLLLRLLNPMRRALDASLAVFILHQAPELTRLYTDRLSRQQLFVHSREAVCVTRMLLGSVNMITRLLLCPASPCLVTGQCRLLTCSARLERLSDFNASVAADEMIPKWLGEFLQQMFTAYRKTGDRLFALLSFQVLYAALTRIRKVKRLLLAAAAKARSAGGLAVGEEDISSEGDTTAVDGTVTFFAELEDELGRRVPAREDFVVTMSHLLDGLHVTSRAGADGSAAAPLHYLAQRGYAIAWAFTDTFEQRVPMLSLMPRCDPWRLQVATTPSAAGGTMTDHHSTPNVCVLTLDPLTLRSAIAAASAWSTWPPALVESICALILASYRAGMSMHKLYHLAVGEKGPDATRPPALLNLMLWAVSAIRAIPANGAEESLVHVRHAIRAVAHVVLWAIHGVCQRNFCSIDEVLLWLTLLTDGQVVLFVHFLCATLQQSLSIAGTRLTETLTTAHEAAASSGGADWFGALHFLVTLWVAKRREKDRLSEDAGRGVAAKCERGAHPNKGCEEGSDLWQRLLNLHLSSLESELLPTLALRWKRRGVIGRKLLRSPVAAGTVADEAGGALSGGDVSADVSAAKLRRLVSRAPTAAGGAAGSAPSWPPALSPGALLLLRVDVDEPEHAKEDDLWVARLLTECPRDATLPAALLLTLIADATATTPPVPLWMGRQTVAAGISVANDSPWLPRAVTLLQSLLKWRGGPQPGGATTRVALAVCESFINATAAAQRSCLLSGADAGLDEAVLACVLWSVQQQRCHYAAAAVGAPPIRKTPFLLTATQWSQLCGALYHGARYGGTLSLRDRLIYACLSLCPSEHAPFAPPAEEDTAGTACPVAVRWFRYFRFSRLHDRSPLNEEGKTGGDGASTATSELDFLTDEIETWLDASLAAFTLAMPLNLPSALRTSSVLRGSDLFDLAFPDVPLNERHWCGGTSQPAAAAAAVPSEPCEPSSDSDDLDSANEDDDDDSQHDGEEEGEGVPGATHPTAAGPSMHRRPTAALRDWMAAVSLPGTGAVLMSTADDAAVAARNDSMTRPDPRFLIHLAFQGLALAARFHATQGHAFRLHLPVRSLQRLFPVMVRMLSSVDISTRRTAASGVALLQPYLFPIQRMLSGLLRSLGSRPSSKNSEESSNRRVGVPPRIRTAVTAFMVVTAEAILDHRHALHGVVVAECLHRHFGYRFPLSQWISDFPTSCVTGEPKLLRTHKHRLRAAWQSANSQARPKEMDTVVRMVRPPHLRVILKLLSASTATVSDINLLTSSHSRRHGIAMLESLKTLGLLLAHDRTVREDVFGTWKGLLFSGGSKTRRRLVVDSHLIAYFLQFARALTGLAESFRDPSSTLSASGAAAPLGVTPASADTMASLCQLWDLLFASLHCFRPGDIDDAAAHCAVEVTRLTQLWTCGGTTTSSPTVSPLHAPLLLRAVRIGCGALLRGDDETVAHPCIVAAQRVVLPVLRGWAQTIVAHEKTLSKEAALRTAQQTESQLLLSTISRGTSSSAFDVNQQLEAASS